MSGSKTIFVANLSFDISEEQLAHVMSEAGPVQGVDIKFGPDGKPKGFGFVQFYDEAASASAVRNLNGVQVNGRALRIEMSSDTPNHTRGGPGGGGGGSARGGGGEGGRPGLPPQRGPGGRERSSPPPPFRPPPPGAGYGGPPPPGPGPGYGAPPPMPVNGGGRVDLSALPPGQDLPRGENAMDQISRTLASIRPGEMQDVMAGMKTLITTQPDQARQLLTQSPQLAYALFQAMLLLNIVDPSVLQQIQPVPANGPPTNAYSQPPPNFPPPPAANPYPTQQAYNQPPPVSAPQGGDPRLNSYRPGPPPPAPGMGYGAPPPAAAPGISPEVQATLNTLPEDQRTTLMTILQMTPDQISGLDAEQRASIMQLRQQFLGV